MALLPYWVENVTPEIERKAKEKLGETPEVKKEALKDLRKLINETPDFCCFENDEFLLRFLRAKKFDVKRTFKTVQNYYDFKKRYPGILTENINTILRSNIVFVHPRRLPDGSGILTLFLGRTDTEKFTVEENFQATMLCSEVCIEEEENQLCGAHFIIDFKGITFKKLRQYSSLSHLAMIIRGLDSCWPFRVNSIHILNEPFYFTLTYNIVWPMLSKKMKERAFFHGSNISSLYKYIPAEYLPSELGGPFQKDVFSRQTKLVIAKQMEMENVKKYSFLTQHKVAKKLSSCGLEEISGFHQNNPAMSKVVT